MTVGFGGGAAEASVTSGFSWPYTAMLINQWRLAVIRRWMDVAVVPKAVSPQENLLRRRRSGHPRC